MSLVFDTLEPFAKELWRNEIWHFVSTAEGIGWRKKIYFGGLYQKVVACKEDGAGGQPHRPRTTQGRKIDAAVRDDDTVTYLS